MDAYCDWSELEGSQRAVIDRRGLFWPFVFLRGLGFDFEHRRTYSGWSDSHDLPKISE